MTQKKRETDANRLLASISAALDPDDPIPIYHQIASVVRRSIASGSVPLGADLPSVRAAAGILGVNYHTVRHAWEALEAEGVVSIRRGRPARVVRAPDARGGWAAAHDAAAAASRPVVWLVTTSLRQGVALAEQVARGWTVVATAWPPGGPPPPPGTILLVGAGAPAPWPARAQDSHPIGLVLDRAALSQVRRAAELLGTSRVVLVGESGGPAGDLLRQLPRVGLRAVAWAEPGFPPEGSRGGTLTLVLPGGDALMPPDARTDPRVMVLEPALAPGPLARVAAAAGWRQVGEQDDPPS